jgi:hypothetical protein
MSEDGASMAMPPAAFAELAELVRSRRAGDTGPGRSERPFDIAVLGVDGLDGCSAASYLSAGATWWLESLSPMRGSIEELEAVVHRGPPR